MEDSNLPKWLAMVLIGFLLFTIALPHIVGSQTLLYNQFIQYKDNRQIRPLSIDQLISHYSEKYNVDEKLARDIIRCESNFNPYAKNTKAVIGVDIGLFQFNTHYWQEELALNGWDIYNIEDNIEAGIWLLSISGTKHWLWSAKCWSNR